MANKAIWFQEGRFYSRLKDVPCREEIPPLRMEVWGYMNPIQTAQWLNENFQEHFAIERLPSSQT